MSFHPRPNFCCPPDRFALAGALAALLTGIGDLRAQTIPQLQTEIAPQGGSYGQTAQTSDGYGCIRVTGDSSTAYTWIRGTLKATLLDKDGNEIVGGNPSGYPELSQSSVSLGSALASVLGSAYSVPSEYSSASWFVDATFDSVTQHLAKMLIANGVVSGNAVQSAAAMLAPAAESALPIVLDYESTAHHGWRLDADGGKFNLDALFQIAVYETVQPSLGGQTVSEFFDDPDTYGKICSSAMHVAITMIGLRDVGIAPPFNPPPQDPTLTSLTPPGNAPKLAKSSRVFLMHAGTNQTVPRPFHMMAFGNQVPIYTIPASQIVVMNASGFSPGMQVAVCAESAPLRVEATLHWSDFGKVSMLLPLLPSGFYRVKYFRRLDPAGSGSFLPWQIIPTGLQPRLIKG